MTDAGSSGARLKLVPFTEYDPIELANQLHMAAAADRSYPSRAPQKYARAGATRTVMREQEEHAAKAVLHYAVVAHVPMDGDNAVNDLVGTVHIVPGAQLYERKSNIPVWLSRLIGRLIVSSYPGLTHRVETWVQHQTFAAAEQRLAVAYDLAIRQVDELTGGDTNAHAWTLLPETNDVTAVSERRAVAGALGRFVAGKFLSPGLPIFSVNNGLYISHIAAYNEQVRNPSFDTAGGQE